MDALAVIVQVSLLVFVVSSMLAMGFSLTVEAIITPLKNLRLVLFALAVNFVAVPIVAWGVGDFDTPGGGAGGARAGGGGARAGGGAGEGRAVGLAARRPGAGLRVVSGPTPYGVGRGRQRLG